MLHEILLFNQSFDCSIRKLLIKGNNFIKEGENHIARDS